MNKRIVASLFVIFLAAILVSGGTMAWFTSQTEISGNIFQAGTLTLGLEEGHELPFALDNLQPGDVYKEEVTVQNIGSLPFKFKVVISENEAEPASGEPGYLPDQLWVTVSMEAGKVYEGTLADLLGADLVYADADGNVVSLPAEDGEGKVAFEVKFLTSAGDDYQASSFSGTITFIATQVNNPGWEQ
jgi:predicted ribosomally synthesized peptide with SipW-like signal peptide